jgi:hypothetical protein
VVVAVALVVVVVSPGSVIVVVVVVSNGGIVIVGSVVVVAAVVVVVVLAVVVVVVVTGTGVNVSATSSIPTDPPMLSPSTTNRIPTVPFDVPSVSEYVPDKLRVATVVQPAPSTFTCTRTDAAAIPLTESL